MRCRLVSPRSRKTLRGKWLSTLPDMSMTCVVGASPLGMVDRDRWSQVAVCLPDFQMQLHMLGQLWWLVAVAVALGADTTPLSTKTAVHEDNKQVATIKDNTRDEHCPLTTDEYGLWRRCDGQCDGQWPVRWCGLDRWLGNVGKEMVAIIASSAVPSQHSTEHRLARLETRCSWNGFAVQSQTGSPQHDDGQASLCWGLGASRQVVGAHGQQWWPADCDHHQHRPRGRILRRVGNFWWWVIKSNLAGIIIHQMCTDFILWSMPGHGHHTHTRIMRSLLIFPFGPSSTAIVRGTLSWPQHLAWPHCRWAHVARWGLIRIYFIRSTFSGNHLLKKALVGWSGTGEDNCEDVATWHRQTNWSTTQASNIKWAQLMGCSLVLSCKYYYY